VALFSDCNSFHNWFKLHLDILATVDSSLQQKN